MASSSESPESVRVDAQGVLLDLQASAKTRCLQALCKRAEKLYGLDAGMLLDRLGEREKLGSTALSDGLAIPHAKIEGLAHPLGLFARLAQPIDFDGDSEQVDLVFLLLVPAAANNDQDRQRQWLAQCARDLREKAQALRDAPDGASLVRLLRP